jgi:hypothetical protein
MNDYFQRSLLIIFAIPVVLFFVQVCTAVPVVSISISSNISSMVLAPGSINQNTLVHLNVTSDNATWTVSVKDASDNSKPSSYAGHMVEWDANTSAYVANPAVLGANMTVTGANVTGSIGSSARLSSADQIIETGSAAVTSLDVPLTFSQEVTYTDPHLTVSNHVYRIVITFTGAAV